MLVAMRTDMQWRIYAILTGVSLTVFLGAALFGPAMFQAGMWLGAVTAALVVAGVNQIAKWD